MTRGRLIFVVLLLFIMSLYYGIICLYLYIIRRMHTCIGCHFEPTIEHCPTKRPSYTRTEKSLNTYRLEKVVKWHF